MAIADCIVIGGGIIGCSVAWRLAQAGLSVRIREAGRIGAQASTAGAGMLAPGGEIHEDSENARFLVRSLRMYPAFIGELEVAGDAPIDFRQNGGIELAFDDLEWQSLRADAVMRASLGIESREWGCGAGMFYPDDGYVDNGALMAVLRRACERCGVAVREHAPVSQIRFSDDGVMVDAEFARTAVLAAGAWSIGINVEADIELPHAFPVKGHLVGYQLPRGSLPHIVRHGHTYVLQRANGFTIAGSSTEHVGFDVTVNQAIAEDVQDRAGRIVPELRGKQPERVWAGLRPGSHGDPVIRRAGDRPLWLAYGHFRNGILGAPATAEIVSREILASLGTR